MDKIIFQVPGCLTKIDSNISRHKFTYEVDKTQISPKDIVRFYELQDKPSYMTVNSHLIEADDIIDLPPLRPVDKDQKTKSQRLRGALYRMWQKSNEGFRTSEQHYDYYMEKFIEHIKGKLED